jgi:hypothetical protein
MMAGLTKEQAAKKGAKKVSLHTEPIHELPSAVDWDEQERIKASLKGKFIPQFRENGQMIKSSYSPERGSELCIFRRAGMNLRQISEQCHVTYSTIKNWLNDYPEFAQEWADAYTDYVTDLAEEIPGIAEKLLKDLKRDGRKLSAKQHGRYMRACEFLATQAQFAARHRAPQLYGDTEGGMELVLVQPQNLPERTVTQDVTRAEKWKEESKEAEDAEVGVPGSDDADGSGGGIVGEADSGGPERSSVPGGDKNPGPKRRDKGGRRGVAEPCKPKSDAGAGPGGD